MLDLSKRPTVIPALVYKDPMKAFEWLQKAFGFQPAFLMTDADGKLAHSEMVFGDGWIMVGSEWTNTLRSPAHLDGYSSQTIHVQMKADVDAHCERARAAGAVILMEPETQFYGDRSYRAGDLEGHQWTFSQTVREMKPEEWDAASGLKTTVW